MVLGPPPPVRFVEQLRQRLVEITLGACVIEANASDAYDVLTLVRELELPLVLLFNRGRLMILPETVSKAAGLREALAGLRLSAHNAIAIGDAENDHRLLEMCEIGVAEGWGSSALKAAAQLPGVVVLGGDDPPPRARELIRALRHPDMSVVIDLSRLGHVEELDYMESLLPTLTMLRRRTGLPHRVVLDEAHYFLSGANVHELLDLELGGYTHHISGGTPSSRRAGGQRNHDRDAGDRSARSAGVRRDERPP